MVWPPGGEKILKIRLFVSTEYTKVTDGRTDRRKEGRTVGWMDGRQTPRDGIGRVYA